MCPSIKFYFQTLEHTTKMEMKITSHLGKILTLFFLALLVVSCGKNDDDANPDPDDDMGMVDDDVNEPNAIPNIIELAETVDMLSMLVDALEAADTGLVNSLSADGSLTVFAPTNDAFNALLDQLEGFDELDDFNETEELALLSEILEYHVVSGTAAFSTDLSDGQVLETLQTESITIAIDGSVFVQDKSEELAEVVSADNDASNGVVHIIDKILLPQSVLDILFPKPTVTEWVVETEELSLLEEAIHKAGLDDDLGEEGPFTLFAPTNSAIEELFDLLGDSFNSFDDFDNFLEIQVLQQILLYHVVPDAITSTDLAPGPVATLLDNETLEILPSADTFVIGDASEIDANLIEEDIAASNGFVHIIDKILIPQEVQDFLDSLSPDDPMSGIPNIKEFVEDSEELAFLKDALEITGLLETLGEDGPYTVFVPTNETITMLFALFGGSLSSLEDFDLDFEIDLLRKVLSYHVVPGVVSSSDLAAGELSTLLPGDSITIGTENGSFFLQDALGLNVDLLLTDIPAGNGIIHTVDRILVPQTVIDEVASEVENTLMDVVGQLEECDLFVNAFMMVRDHLDDDILEAEITLFLPTNSAFLELFSTLDGIESLADFDSEEEIRLLADILGYHLVNGTKARSSDLTNNQVLTTFQGETLNIIIGDSIYIMDKTGDNSKVTVADTEVLNGVVHIVDKVLLPQQVIDYISI